MDILSAKHLSEDQIIKTIEMQESMWPTLKVENDLIRKNKDKLLEIGITEDEINSAMISDCRSDYMNCGRCALRFNKKLY